MRCRAQSKLIQTVAANYVLWPFAHFVNFRFIPNEHRILYNNVVSVRSPRLAADPSGHLPMHPVRLVLGGSSRRQRQRPALQVACCHACCSAAED